MAERVQSVCPEAGFRQSLTDDDFWAHVLLGETPGDAEPDLDDLVSMVSNQGQPCPECGEYTACAYDAEGRLMTHTITDDNETEGARP